MSEMSKQLKTLRDYHTTPYIGYRRGHALTHHILNVLLDHALNAYVPKNFDAEKQRPRGTYKVLLLSQPDEPGLIEPVEHLRMNVNEPYRRWVPQVHVDAPELTDLNRPSESKWHAVVSSTRLEHENDAKRGLIALHERLEQNGCLLLVSHMPNGAVAPAMERDATNLKLAFQTLEDYAQRRISRKAAANRLREFDFHKYCRVKTLQSWLDQFKDDPEARRVVTHALRNDAFASPLIVAARLRSKTKTHEQWSALLDDVGFHVHPPYAFEVGHEGHRVCIHAAYKGTCPQELRE